MQQFWRIAISTRRLYCGFWFHDFLCRLRCSRLFRRSLQAGHLTSPLPGLHSQHVTVERRDKEGRHVAECGGRGAQRGARAPVEIESKRERAARPGAPCTLIVSACRLLGPSLGLRDLEEDEAAHRHTAHRLARNAGHARFLKNTRDATDLPPHFRLPRVPAERRRREHGGPPLACSALSLLALAVEQKTIDFTRPSELCPRICRLEE